MKTSIVKKITAVMLSLAMIIPAMSFFASATEVTAGTTVTILHTNDVHGAVRSVKDSSGNLTTMGYDYIATMKKELDAILVDSGDYTQGTLMVSLSKGENAIKMMNATGYDVATLGNHEFDYGSAKTLSNFALAEFVTIAGNVKNKETGKNFLENVGKTEGNNGATYIIEKNGKKIGFFGIDTAETKTASNPANTQDVIFEEELKSSQEMVNTLKAQNVDLVVGLVHCGDNVSAGVTGKSIAQNVDGVDLVLDGHSHTLENETYTNAKTGKEVLVMQETTANAKIGKIDVTFNQDGSHSFAHKNIDAKEVGQTYSPDKTVTNLLDSVYNEFQEWANVAVSAVNGQLFGSAYNGYNSMIRGIETNLGDYVADAYLSAVQKSLQDTEYKDTAVVSIANGGGIRTSMGGVLTNGKIYTTLPFSNSIIGKCLTVKELYATLECGVKDLTLEDNYLTNFNGGFPQVGGMAIEWDVTATPKTSDSPGDRVKAVYLLKEDGSKGQLLDKNDDSTKIILACTSFLGSGGNEYDTLKDKPVVYDNNISEFNTALNGINDRLIANDGKLEKFVANKGRITISGADKIFGSYDAVFTAKDNDNIVANETLTVYVDNSDKAVEYKTDANGQFTVKGLSQGTHEFWVTLHTGSGDKTAQLMSTNYIKDLANITFDFDTYQYKANEVTNVINAIPTDATVYDKAYWVHFARNLYDAMISGEKAKITSETYKKLTDAEAKLGGKSGENGWQQTNGKWQYYQDGKFLTDWQNNIPGWEGQWFYFDRTTGYSKSAWANDIHGWEGQWFYFNPNTCVMMKGWVNDGGVRFFYLDDNTGVMKKGWHYLNWSGGANWFYFDNNGSCLTNTMTPDGFKVDANGVWVQ